MITPPDADRSEIPASTARQPGRSRLRALLMTFGLVGLCVLVFGQTAGYEFVDWDDELHLHNNPLFNPPTLDKLAAYWREPYQGMYAPLTYSYWYALAVGAKAASPDAGYLQPRVFHAANVALHMLNVLLIWTLLAKLLRRADIPPWRATWCAGFAAALFAVHPLAVESVAWVSEARGLLSAALLLAGFCAYLSFLEHRTVAPTPRGGSGFYVAAWALFALAMIAKPSAVVVPLLVGIVDLVWYRRPVRLVVPSALPLLATAAVIAWIGRSAQSPPKELADLGLGDRFLVAGDALTFYLRKLVWPLPLGIDYGRSPQAVLASSTVYLSAFVGFAVVGVLCLLPPRRVWQTAIGWFVAALFPVLGLVIFQFQMYSTTADRYAYLALVGPALALAYGLHRLTDRLAAPTQEPTVAGHGEDIDLRDDRPWPRRHPAQTVVAGSFVVLAVVGLITAAACRPWRNNFELKMQAVRANPASLVGLQGLGIYWSAHRDLGRATAYFEQAVASHPTHPKVHALLGMAYYRGNRLDDALREAELAARDDPHAAILVARTLLRLDRPAEALTAAQSAAALDPDDADVRATVTTAEALLGRIDDRQRLHDVAERHVAAALECLDWNDAPGYDFNLTLAERFAPQAACLEYCRGRAAEHDGRAAAALDCYERAVAAEPKVEYLMRLGGAYRAANRRDDALATFQRVLDADPRSAAAHNNLGVLLVGTDRAAARRHYEAALAIDPSYADAYSNLGNVVAREGNWTAAVEHYRKALALDPNLAAAKNNLAVAEREAAGRH